MKSLKIDHPQIYCIIIKGCINPDWAEWFPNLKISADEQGNTQLVGPVMDQSALHGILERIRDLNLKLVSVAQETTECPQQGKR
jgi:hypothetical protein